MAAHPGFQAAAKTIQHEGYSKEAAGAILANSTRKASKSAKKKNPRLNRVKMAKDHADKMSRGLRT